MLNEMAAAFKTAHPNISTIDAAVSLWNSSYSGHFETANDEAYHFTAFRKAFLDNAKEPEKTLISHWSKNEHITNRIKNLNISKSINGAQYKLSGKNEITVTGLIDNVIIENLEHQGYLIVYG